MRYSTTHTKCRFQLHVLALAHDDAQHKIDNHRRGQRARQHRRAEAIVKTADAAGATDGAAGADAARAPVEDAEGVEHGGHGDEGEAAGADLADAVAKVEQADGEAAEDDAEVEPREKGALVGEEDFGLDARGEGDALACRGRVSG